MVMAGSPGGVKTTAAWANGISATLAYITPCTYNIIWTGSYISTISVSACNHPEAVTRRPYALTIDTRRGNTYARVTNRRPVCTAVRWPWIVAYRRPAAVITAGWPVATITAAWWWMVWTSATTAARWSVRTAAATTATAASAGPLGRGRKCRKQAKQPAKSKCWQIFVWIFHGCNFIGASHDECGIVLD